MLSKITIALGVLAFSTSAMAQAQAERGLAQDLVVNDNAAGNPAEPAPCDVPPDFTTIQAALDVTVDGDWVAVCPGSYVEAISVTANGVTLSAVDRSDPALTVIVGTKAGVECGTVPGTGNVSLTGADDALIPHFPGELRRWTF